LKQRRFLAFGLVTAFLATAMLLTALHGAAAPVPQKVFETNKHVAFVAEGTSDNNTTVVIPGAENGFLVAIGGIIGLVVVLTLFIAPAAIRAKKKK